MPLEPKFIGLDSTAWTALSTIAALLIATVGAFAPAIKKRIVRPKLRLSCTDVHAFSSISPNGEAYWMRLPIINDARRTVARNVEVFLNAVRPLEGQAMGHFIPMRLLWCHVDSPVCDRIAGETTKLINFGRSYINGRSIAEGKPLANPEPPYWIFGGESWSFAPRIPLRGLYEIELHFIQEDYSPALQTLFIDFNSNAERPTIRTR